MYGNSYPNHNFKKKMRDRRKSLRSKRYQIICKIGEGTYGKVYKCLDTFYQKIVAIKKIRLQDKDEGVPSTAIREISILKEINHLNIVRLKETFDEREKLYLVFEHLDYDLKKYMDNQADIKIHPDLVKKFVFQLLCAVDFMHSNRIIHRDLKPQNILIDKKGTIKICDFGLARAFSIPMRAYTHEVITLWYRAPEILLGQQKYSSSVDIWSLGCIIAELVNLKPLFQGDSEIDELMKIFEILGAPNEQSWPGVTKLQYYNPIFPKWNRNKLGFILKKQDVLFIDLVKRMIVVNPEKRITAKAALNHPYFDSIWDELQKQGVKQKEIQKK